MEHVSENIVRRIQLLFEMANRSEGNEVEAAAAMNKAQELLVKYNLDLATVKESKVKGGTNAATDEEKRERVKVNRSAMYNWQRKLVSAIAQANFCWYWHTTEWETYNSRQGEKSRKVKRHKILGREGNTTVVIMMVEYLFVTIERILPYPNVERLSKSAISWREGCADRLIERIQAKAEEMRTPDYATQGEAAYSTALAIRNVTQSEDQANYDAYYGEGAWLRNQENNKAYAERLKLREVEEQAALAKKLAEETPAQKARREREEAKQREKDAREAERYWERYYRQQAREHNKRDHVAYSQGQRVGSQINLDSQLDKGKTKGQL